MADEPRPILAIDITDYSTLSIERMLEVTRLLETLILKSFSPGFDQEFIWSPAGDGGALSFTSSKEAFHVAIKLSELVYEYNKEHIADKLRIKMGLHVGTIVIRQHVLSEATNVWGPGINTASRIVGLAEPNQILSSEQFCGFADMIDSHKQPINEGVDYLTYIGEWLVKHDELISLYNIHNGNIGKAVTTIHYWQTPFLNPEKEIVRSYEQLLKRERNSRGKSRAIRAIAIIKKIMDISPQNELALETINIITRREVAELHHDFLSFLHPKELEYLLAYSTLPVYSQGALLAKQGEIATCLFIIISGALEVHIEETDYYEIFDDGAVLGEMGLFEDVDHPKRNATITAVRDCIVLQVEYERIADIRGIDGNHRHKDTLTEEEHIGNVIFSKIKDRIFDRRVKEHTINKHPLFVGLDEFLKREFIDKAEYISERGGVYLDEKVPWENLLIVISGHLSLILDVVTPDKSSPYPVSRSEDECIGFLQLEFANNPFVGIHIVQDTKLIAIPWQFVDLFFLGNQQFRENCRQYIDADSFLKDSLGVENFGVDYG